ncbi:MAG: hypothetical protein QOH84_5435, partial [Kribbellaceae bacterium]|nr:hypothetical protein [Kribbellaceae bacterium]
MTRVLPRVATRPRPRREESGAVAIMVAIMALLLMGTAALAVDLGQAFVRHRAITHDTDLAAYAGAYGSNLPITNAPTAGGCFYGAKAHSSDQAVQDVATYFNLNSSNPGQSLPSTTAASLVDCNVYNGEVLYGKVTGNGPTTSLTYNANYLTVISPQSQVDFTLGQALGKTKTQ